MKTGIYGGAEAGALSEGFVVVLSQALGTVSTLLQVSLSCAHHEG